MVGNQMAKSRTGGRGFFKAATEPAEQLLGSLQRGFYREEVRMGEKMIVTATAAGLLP